MHQTTATLASSPIRDRKKIMYAQPLSAVQFVGSNVRKGRLSQEYCCIVDVQLNITAPYLMAVH